MSSEESRGFESSQRVTNIVGDLLLSRGRQRHIAFDALLMVEPTHGCVPGPCCYRVVECIVSIQGKGYWRDAGSFRTLFEANKYWAKKNKS